MDREPSPAPKPELTSISALLMMFFVKALYDFIGPLLFVPPGFQLEAPVLYELTGPDGCRNVSVSYFIMEKGSSEPIYC